MKKIFCFLIWVFCITISISVYATNNFYSGIDVSNWQGYINYKEVKNSRY